MPRALPTRPLLAPWQRLVEDGDRLLLEHGRRVVVLEGAAVRSFLPRLLPLLDGSRTVDDLSAAVGVAVRPALEHTLEVLMAQGLLLEGTGQRSVNDSAWALAATYGLGPEGVMKRLEAASVGIVGSSAVAASIGSLFENAGVGEVVRCEWWQDIDLDLSLAVVAPARAEVGELSGWNERTLTSGTRWLCVRPYDGALATVGPLVVPLESCCYACLLIRLGAHLEYGPDLERIEATPIVARPVEGLDTILTGIAAHLALTWLGGLDAAIPGGLVAVTTTPRLAVTDHTILRVPRCGACSPVERRAAPLPWFETSQFGTVQFGTGQEGGQ